MRRAYYGHTRSDYNKRKKRRKKRDWHRSEFNNPYFTKQQPINLKLYLYFMATTIMVGVLVYLLFFINYWKIGSVTISGDGELGTKINKIINDYFGGKLYSVVDRNNYFVLNADYLQEEISNNLLVKDLEIKKSLPNKLEVSFNKIVPAYIWVQNDRYYHIDENAMVLEELISVQNNTKEDKNAEASDGFNLEDVKYFLKNSSADLDLSIIYTINNDDKNYSVRDYAIDENTLEIIKKINTKISELNIDILLYKINDEELRKLEIYTEDGWQIYFNSQNDLDKQLGNLESLMATTFKDVNPNEYIDLRFGNKIYYK